MRAFQQRRRIEGSSAADVDRIVARVAREILAHPTAERMMAFTASMAALRDALAAENPGVSKRHLATRGQELGLRILHQITAAAHREKLNMMTKKGLT
jgi:hypothetical protein